MLVYLVLCQYVGMFGNYLGYLHFVYIYSLYRNHLWGIQLQFWTWQQLQCLATETDWSQDPAQIICHWSVWGLQMNLCCDFTITEEAPTRSQHVVNVFLAQCLNIVLNVKELVGAFKQVGAFSSVITNLLIDLRFKLS